MMVCMMLLGTGDKGNRKGGERSRRIYLQSTSPCLASLLSFADFEFTVARGIGDQRILSLPIILSSI